MKMIEAVMTATKLHAVKAALHEIGIEKIMVSQIAVNGRKKGNTLIHWGAGCMSGFMSRIRVEIVAADELVGRVIGIIGEIASTERIGDCRIVIRSLGGGDLQVGLLT